VICLTEKDLRKLADCLGELYQPCALDAFGQRVLGVLAGLVGCDARSYDAVGPGGAVVAQTAPDGFAFPGMVQAFQQHMGQHPLLRHFRGTRDEHAAKVSDFLSLREFRQLPLYRDLYRLAGVDRQLAVTLPGGPGVLIGLAVSRSGRDFSERDRAALDFLRPHVIRAHASAAALTTAGLNVLTLGQAAMDGCGAVGLTERETEVISLAAKGRTNREIAGLLGISPLTVRKHLEHAYPKLGVGNRTEAAARLR
jgi:DNA-binding CsgD family transcriptional regulator